MIAQQGLISSLTDKIHPRPTLMWIKVRTLITAWTKMPIWDSKYLLHKLQMQRVVLLPIKMAKCRNLVDTCKESSMAAQAALVNLSIFRRMPLSKSKLFLQKIRVLKILSNSKHPKLLRLLATRIFKIREITPHCWFQITEEEEDPSPLTLKWSTLRNQQMLSLQGYKKNPCLPQQALALSTTPSYRSKSPRLQPTNSDWIKTILTRTLRLLVGIKNANLIAL